MRCEKISKIINMKVIRIKCIFVSLCSQIVALPYQTLLHKSTRESCGIRLKGNIVIVDEAHNLLDTISNIHSVHINGAQVKGCARMTGCRQGGVGGAGNIQVHTSMGHR